MPGLWLQKYQPPPGNPLYTTVMAAEAGVEMRFELLSWEAQMAFPDLRWDLKGAASRGLTMKEWEESFTKHHREHLPQCLLVCIQGKEGHREKGR